MEGLSDTSEALYTDSGMFTPHGITIRDPETGATFLQTQLLQVRSENNGKKTYHTN